MSAAKFFVKPYLFLMIKKTAPPTKSKRMEQMTGPLTIQTKPVSAEDRQKPLGMKPEISF